MADSNQTGDSKNEPSAIQLAQRTAKQLRHEMGLEQVTEGAIVSLLYALPETRDEHLRALLQALGEEPFCAWVKARKRKNLPFEATQDMGDTSRITKEYDTMSDLFDLPARTEAASNPSHALEGEGTYYILKNNRWTKKQAKIEELPELLDADTICFDDLKLLKGSIRYAFVSDFETQMSDGTKRVRLASTRTEAVRRLVDPDYRAE